MATAGKILMFPVGNWTSGNNYGFLDIVYYGGSSYVAKTDITNSTTNPATDTTNWQILAHGYIADTLSGIDGIDTSGLIGTAGAIVSSQALMDKIADMVATKLVLKTSISNQQVNDTAKVTGSALSYSMGQSIDTLNSNLTNVSGNLTALDTSLNWISIPFSYNAALTDGGTVCRYNVKTKQVFLDGIFTLTGSVNNANALMGIDQAYVPRGSIGVKLYNANDGTVHDAIIYGTQTGIAPYTVATLKSLNTAALPYTKVYTFHAVWCLR